MKSLPEAMYWTSSFLIGEWSLIDFSRAGGMICIFCCLVGMLLFAIPLGIISEAVQSALMLELVEHQVEEQLKGRSPDDLQADLKWDPSAAADAAPHSDADKESGASASPRGAAPEEPARAGAA